MIETQAEPSGRPGQDLSDGSRFRRHSIFEQATAESFPVDPQAAAEQPDWLEEARSEIEERGQYLAFVADGAQHIVRLQDGWTRIGRSRVANLRLDHSTVSRRHALIVNGEDRGLRVLDDRSLNGIYLNGRRIEWAALEDGDELQVGRYHLFVIDSSLVEAAS